MGYIELTDVSYALPGGWTLFERATFRVPEGSHAALVGANGIGKSTMLRLIAGLETPASGVVRADGRVGLMRQFIGSERPVSVREFLLAYSEPHIVEAARELRSAEERLARDGGERSQLAFADALARWESAGGYSTEVIWDACAHAAFGGGYPEAADRLVSTLSGGEQKRLALEVMFRTPYDVLLLDEPDNVLDLDAKRWLEAQISSSPRTILFVSHDRAVLASTTDRVVTLEGRGVWVHPQGFGSYAEAREARIERIDDEHRRYAEQHRRLVAYVKEMKRRAAYNAAMSSRAKAAVTRLARFERERAPTAKPETQDVRMRIEGGRTGKRALRLRGFSLTGLTQSFDAEVLFGERIGVIGPNGSGKTHFLRLLAGEDVAHEGEWRLGTRVEPGLFSQLHDRSGAADLQLAEVLMNRGMHMGEVMSILKRYELARAARDPFRILSGGQQARFQLLLMELDSPTMLLLDEPTDNLDVIAAEALEDALARYEGTVIAATHDRWLMRTMDRFLHFDADGSVEELLESTYGLDESTTASRPSAPR